MSRNLFIIICLLVFSANADNCLPNEKKLPLAFLKLNNCSIKLLNCVKRVTPYDAIQVLSKAIVHHATNENFIAKSELLSAELYIDLNMLSAADATAKQVMIIYMNSDVAIEAASLRGRIEQLKLEAERIEDEEK